MAKQTKEAVATAEVVEDINLPEEVVQLPTNDVLNSNEKNEPGIINKVKEGCSNVTLYGVRTIADLIKLTPVGTEEWKRLKVLMAANPNRMIVVEGNKVMVEAMRGDSNMRSELKEPKIMRKEDLRTGGKYFRGNITRKPENEEGRIKFYLYGTSKSTEVNPLATDLHGPTIVGFKSIGTMPEDLAIIPIGIRTIYHFVMSIDHQIAYTTTYEKEDAASTKRHWFHAKTMYTSGNIFEVIDIKIYEQHYAEADLGTIKKQVRSLEDQITTCSIDRFPQVQYKLTYMNEKLDKLEAAASGK